MYVSQLVSSCPPAENIMLHDPYNLWEDFDLLVCFLVIHGSLGRAGVNVGTKFETLFRLGLAR